VNESSSKIESSTTNEPSRLIEPVEKSEP
jgi:hypothetical protein